MNNLSNLFCKLYITVNLLKVNKILNYYFEYEFNHYLNIIYILTKHYVIIFMFNLIYL